MTIPNKVLVVKQFNTEGTDIAVGDLVVLDGEKGSVISAADAVTTNKIQFGVVKREAVVSADPSKAIPAYIVKTKAFTRNDIVKYNAVASEAAVEDSFDIDYTGVKTATASSPLAVVHANLTFDLDGRDVKREESYVIKLSDYSTDAAVAGKIAALINGNRESWATAEVAGAVVTVTAKTAIDNQPGAKSILSAFPYNQTKMKVVSFHKDNESVLSNYGTSGIAVSHETVATPGINNPYVIRDHEKAAFGYDSAHFSHVYPNQAPMTGLAVTYNGDVDASVEYDCVSFVVDLKYRAADTNYTKSTTVYNSIYGDNETFVTDDVIAVINGTYTED